MTSSVGRRSGYVENTDPVVAKWLGYVGLRLIRKRIV